MSDAIVALAKSVLPKDDGFRINPTEAEMFMLAKEVIRLTEAVMSAEELINIRHNKISHEGQPCKACDWLSKYGKGVTDGV